MGLVLAASIWGALWAIIAVAAGLAAAAITHRRQRNERDPGELDAGYNALAPTLRQFS